MDEFMEKNMQEDEIYDILDDYFDYVFIKYTNKLTYSTYNKISKILCINTDVSSNDLILDIKKFMKDELEIYNELIVFLEYGDRYEGGSAILMYLNKDR